ncbi:hypothetical protein BU23DRAFT_287805 [Bimuria novae-zelandiae CBS 107.79]|uniref:Uncharacterized protein n=1 Tax=Bimuria novae-zelandiae CBS 107.79 TaxID=1447943 RepID=A0A6A5US88_9PLEO|nr:hypothetical protein BU23DRAFT_287805 [Bimuria novae-zelandiae CBS 107.79]
MARESLVGVIYHRPHHHRQVKRKKPVKTTKPKKKKKTVGEDEDEVESREAAPDLDAREEALAKREAALSQGPGVEEANPEGVPVGDAGVAPADAPADAPAGAPGDGEAPAPELANVGDGMARMDRLLAQIPVLNNPHKPNLEGIPAEIRFQIYQYLLIAPDAELGPIERIHSKDRRNIPSPPTHRLPPDGAMRQVYPQIMRTNRRIYEESYSVLWGENLFSSDDETMLMDEEVPFRTSCQTAMEFLARYNTRVRDIRRLRMRVEVPAYNWETPFETDQPFFDALALAQIEGLQRLEVNLEYEMCLLREGYGRVAKGLFRMAVNWLEVVGRWTGNRSAALDVLVLRDTHTQNGWWGDDSDESDDSYDLYDQREIERTVEILRDYIETLLAGGDSSQGAGEDSEDSLFS